jgi:hypothetical protein
MREAAHHTPEPWRGTGRGVVLAGQHGVDLCGVAQLFSGRSASFAELSANEDLIVAAPALLRLLRQLLPAARQAVPERRFWSEHRAVEEAAALLSQLDGSASCASQAKPEADPLARTMQALREVVDAVHDGEPAGIARAVRGAVAVLQSSRIGEVLP